MRIRAKKFNRREKLMRPGKVDNPWRKCLTIKPGLKKMCKTL